MMAYCSTCGECHYAGQCPLDDTQGGENKMTDLLPCPFCGNDDPLDDGMPEASLGVCCGETGCPIDGVVFTRRDWNTRTPNKPAEVDLDAAIQLVRSGFIVRENIGDLQFDKYAKALELIISLATGKGGGEPAAPTQIDAGESEAALDNIAAVELIAKWMIHHGFTTGRGDTIEGLLNELSWQIAEIKTEGDDGGHATEQQPPATPTDRVRVALDQLINYAQDSNGNQYGSLCASLVEHIAQQALSELDGIGWQPIETAPKDGTEVLTFCEGQVPEIVSMKFISGDEYALWIFTDEALSDICPEPEQPTHWMPLPAPPGEDE